MSSIVPAPTTAPMFTTAPIIPITCSPISAPSRMMHPGSIRVFTGFRSRSGIAELRRSFSRWWYRTLSAPSSTARTRSHSPIRIDVSGPAGNTFRSSPGSTSSGPSWRTCTVTGVVFFEFAMMSRIFW